MPSQRAKILNPDGSLYRWVSRATASRMEIRGEVKREPSSSPWLSYRLPHAPESSNSNLSFGGVTAADMRAVAGLDRVSMKRLERLIGKGLIPEGTQMPRGGYL